MATNTAKKSSTAKKAEATDKPTTFDFYDLEFTIPSAKKLPMDILEAIEDDRGEVVIIRSIVGPEQWATFKSLSPTIEDFEGFAEQVAEAAGFGSSGN
ncbi:hypothetical protein [Streptomyces rimosus]|uniref:hypothetical protein n=1 Tax=Streptomyces rimosus TaxID=1927 RepID=UPI0004C18976|nr:hypothetical protein [Streptomyces rimosus]